MSSRGIYLQLQYVCQAALCLYGARASWIAIVNLRKYEETTKKLAEWSTEVERQLWKTRKTQTAGAAAILSGLVCSLLLAVAPNRLPQQARMAVTPVLLVGVLYARHYIKDFWTPTKDQDGKPVGLKVPLPNMGDYNVAVQATENLLQALEYLEYSCVGAIVVSGLVGFGEAAAK